MSDEDKSSELPYNLNQGFPFSSISDHHDFNPFLLDQNPSSGFDPYTGYFHESMKYNTANLGANIVNCNTSYSSSNLGETCSTENPPTTPNSSISFLSSDAGVEEECDNNIMEDLQQKVCEDGDVKSKKV